MKKTLFLVLALLAGTLLQAQEYRFNAKADGFSVKSKSNTTLNIDYNVSGITLENADREGLEGQFLNLKGIHIANQAGAPNLPSSSTFVAIPNGAKATLSMVSSKTKLIQDVDLIPAPQPQLDNDNSPAIYQKDMSIYSRNAFYPETPFQISGTLTVRGVEMVQVGIMPFQYNPVTKELLVYEDLELKLETEGGDGQIGDLRYRTPEWDHILSDMLLNREVLPEVDYGERLRKHFEQRETGCEYVIITPDNDEFVQMADSIRRFRIAQGIPTEIFRVTECGGNNEQAIKSFIQNAYNTWDMPPAAVLILGDHNTDPTQGVVSYTMNNHPSEGYNPYISDHAYSDMNNNMMSDIILGRITGRNYEELHHMIKKDIDYERTPPTNPDFYDKPITAMGFQLERWFQLCSEIINGFFENGLGKHPVRANAIYEGTPGSRWSSADHTNSIVNYFGPNGCGYIPQNMSHLTEWDGNGNMINNCINSGAFILQHRDHGAEELWGEPSYSIGNINRLTNPDLTYVMSCNCLTGRFNYSGANGCFAEAFHRHQHGALGLIAATQVSYSFVNDVYVWGMYDNMWPDFMPTYGTQHPTDFILPAFGNAAGKYFLRQSSWAGDWYKEITYYLFHQHGDAYMNLYSEVPQTLDVEMLPVLVAGSDRYQLKVDEGATVCLTVNDQIIGYAISTGNVQNITITPQPVGTRILLTIKKQNYYRYEHEILTIADDAPYLILNTLEINDAEGNNNQAPDYNETCKLGVSLHNVGFREVSNVQATLSCQHPKVHITGSEASFGIINPDETSMVNDAFKIQFDETFNDGETVRLFLTMGDCSHVYRDSIDLKINAPVLKCTGVSFSDLDGEPTDRFLKGESSLMTFDITNTGHSKSLGLTSILAIDASFLDITGNPLSLEGIECGETAQATFRVNLHNDAPKGNILNYTYDAESGSRTIHHEDRASLGYTTEDFEDEDLNPNIVWNLGSGNKKWYIVEDSTATEGYCLHSQSKEDYTMANLQLAVTCSLPESFTFNLKTRLEERAKLRLLVNTEEVAAWNDSTDWEHYTFNLKEGQNLIKFTFQTNGEVGNNYVLIDHMLFPPEEDLYVFAGDETTTVFEEPFTPNSCVLYQDELLWTTDGDGTFDDPTLEQPTYFFGADDMEKRFVTLTLTAKRNGSEQSDSILVTSSSAVDENSACIVKVYPNPSNGLIHISADNIPSGQVTIRMIDNLGRVIYTKERSIDGHTLMEHINTKTMGHGLYNLQIIQGEQVFNTRVVIL